MSNRAWQKVSELLGQDYPPEFNAGAAYELVLAAWRMGFDLVRQPAGVDLYQAHIQEEAAALAPASQLQQMGLQNMVRR